MLRALQENLVKKIFMLPGMPEIHHSKLIQLSSHLYAKLKAYSGSDFHIEGIAVIAFLLISDVFLSSLISTTPSLAHRHPLVCAGFQLFYENPFHETHHAYLFSQHDGV